MNDHEAIAEVFTADLPESVRVMNCGAVTTEIIFGRDEDGDVGDAVYDRFRKALDEMVDEGILQTGEALGEKVYGLTVEWQERYAEQAKTWLRNLLTRTEAEAQEKYDLSNKKYMPLEHRADLIRDLLTELEVRP